MKWVLFLVFHTPFMNDVHFAVSEMSSLATCQAALDEALRYAQVIYPGASKCIPVQVDPVPTPTPSPQGP